MCIEVHPPFEYDLNGKNYDQYMTIFDPELRLKYEKYVKIETIIMTIHIHEKKLNVCTNNALDRKTRLKWLYLSNPLHSHSFNHHCNEA